jgi:uncharacterized membrane protein
MCVLSTTLVFLAKKMDTEEMGRLVPAITTESVETLLTIIATSMLVIATFSVASMVSAYASASNVATPRSFSLVIADDVSQNALSTFIGAFIYSIVALVALMNGYYEKGGRFVLFALTLIVLAMVIVTFVGWVDRIARLGRLGGTIEKVEVATAEAMRRRQQAPILRGAPVEGYQRGGQTVYGQTIGYIHRIDVNELQTFAEKFRVRIRLAVLPGVFSAPGRVLAYVSTDSGALSDLDTGQIAKAFLIGKNRLFDEDPRFGLVVLSEIASRALSPAVNDPGTAICVTGVLVRLFAQWSHSLAEHDIVTAQYDRVEVPELSVQDMFDDAFTAIGRDGAGFIEVAGQLQKAFASLAVVGDTAMRETAKYHSRLALARVEKVMQLPEDLEIVRKLANFSHSV